MNQTQRTNASHLEDKSSSQLLEGENPLLRPTMVTELLATDSFEMQLNVLSCEMQLKSFHSKTACEKKKGKEPLVTPEDIVSSASSRGSHVTLLVYTLELRMR